MPTDARFEALRRAGQAALASQRAVVAACAELEKESVLAPAPEDIQLLVALITARVAPLPAFGVLARVSLEGARTVLLRNYLGAGVDPDGKFGGFLFELSTMLDDLRIAHGDEALRALAHDGQASPTMFDDPRITTAFAEALDLSEADLPHWLEAKPPPRP